MPSSDSSTPCRTTTTRSRGCASSPSISRSTPRLLPELLHPARVEPLRHVLQRGQALAHLRLDLLHALHRGAVQVGRDFAGAARNPARDHLGRHLDVALQAEVAVVDDVGLVGAVLAGEDALAARRDGEGLAMPLEGHELAQVFAEPAARERRVLAAYAVPSDLLHRIALHFRTERLGEHLSAEAVPDDRHPAIDGVAHEIEYRDGPLEIVVGAHRPAHESQPGELGARGGNRLALVELQQLPGGAGGGGECGKKTPTFGVRGTKNRDPPPGTPSCKNTD